METVFDHNPTDVEYKRLAPFGGKKALEWAVSKGLYKHDSNRLYHLGLLFAGRGEKEKANEYFSQIDKGSDILSTLMHDF